MGRSKIIGLNVEYGKWRNWRHKLGLLVKHLPPIPVPKPKPVVKPTMVAMFDCVSVSRIPRSAPAVAGYVGGKWTTWPAVVKGWPDAHKLSIAVTAAENADCLDVEPGDATNAQAAAWVKRQQARGLARPTLYTSVSNWPALERALAAAGVKKKLLRPRPYKRWSAHYTFHPHLCSKACGYGFQGTADATQWTDEALGRSLDQSLCAPGFFDSSIAA